MTTSSLRLPLLHQMLAAGASRRKKAGYSAVPWADESQVLDSALAHRMPLHMFAVAIATEPLLDLGNVRWVVEFSLVRHQVKPQ